MSNFEELPGMAHIDCERGKDQKFVYCNESERDPYLYNLPHNYADFAADENGVWVVYMLQDMNHIVVSKLDYQVPYTISFC